MLRSLMQHRSLLEGNAVFKECFGEEMHKLGAMFVVPVVRWQELPLTSLLHLDLPIVCSILSGRQRSTLGRTRLLHFPHHLIVMPTSWHGCWWTWC